MNRFIKTVLILFVFMSTAFAQDGNMEETWIGTYIGKTYDEARDAVKSATKKLYVCINKFGDDYKIRIKEVDVVNPFNVWYFDGNYAVIKYDESTIGFTYTDKKSCNYTWDNKLTGMDQRKFHYLLNYNNGMMHISPLKAILIEYDKCGNLERKTDMSNMDPYIFKDVDLYKEGKDW